LAKINTPLTRTRWHSSAHGGTITFETKPDEGTVFIVSIPTSQPATAMLARS